MATYILMRNGTIYQEVRSDDVERWKAYGYEVADDPSLSSDSGKEVAGDASVSPVAPTVTPKKRTTTRKKGAQNDDKS